MHSRVKLQAELEKLLGSRNVYFQPPATVRMSYPAIVYERSKLNNRHANDTVYLQDIGYQVTVIDKNPDSEIVAKVSKLPKCRWDRHFESEHLNHDVFTLYY